MGDCITFFDVSSLQDIQNLLINERNALRCNIVTPNFKTSNSSLKEIKGHTLNRIMLLSQFLALKSRFDKSKTKNNHIEIAIYYEVLNDCLKRFVDQIQAVNSDWETLLATQKLTAHSYEELFIQWHLACDLIQQITRELYCFLQQKTISSFERIETELFSAQTTFLNLLSLKLEYVKPASKINKDYLYHSELIVLVRDYEGVAHFVKHCFMRRDPYEIYQLFFEAFITYQLAILDSQELLIKADWDLRFNDEYVLTRHANDTAIVNLYDDKQLRHTYYRLIQNHPDNYEAIHHLSGRILTRER